MATREQILEEIRQLAKRFGRSPGKTLFQKETGIPESQWYGRYWLSWGDALKEAGLTANRVPPKITQNTLLRRYAEVVRHFGSVPSKAQLRMYAKRNPGFPGLTTFYKSFGDKQRLINALATWVRENTDFADLINLLPDPMEEHVSSAPRGEDFVYLLKSGNHFKIGRSDKLERRVKQISITLPEEVTLVHTIRTDDPPGIEAYWHRRFAERRAKGEWFRLSATDVRAFKRRRFQ